jgi:hypothetical protein
MQQYTKLVRVFLIAVAAASIFCLGASMARADKLHLKDGRVLEGTVESEGDGFMYFKYKVGGIEQSTLFSSADITKLERDSATNPVPSAPTPGKADKPAVTGKAEESKPAVAAAKPKASKDGKRVERLAILNFGPPSSWGKDPRTREVESTVGVQISASAFKNAIPMLEKDGVTAVAVRINSGGGYLSELAKFHEVLQNDFKPRFRTVGWVESAISAAAMSPWVLEEFYMLPEGNIGACTGWYGRLQAMKGIELEVVLAMMEDASRKGGRDPKIMRSMQICCDRGEAPLSADIDPVTGDVTWHQDVSGQFLLNPPNQILTFTAEQAVKFKFAKAIAATPEDLAHAMFGEHAEFEFGGKDAADYVDSNMIESDTAEKHAIEVVIKYVRRIEEAAATQDRAERGALVGQARTFLHQLKRWCEKNPNLEQVLGNKIGVEALDKEWFQIEEERLKNLMK